MGVWRNKIGVVGFRLVIQEQGCVQSPSRSRYYTTSHCTYENIECITFHYGEYNG
jgi:hypothetical protein